MISTLADSLLRTIVQSSTNQLNNLETTTFLIAVGFLWNVRIGGLCKNNHSYARTYICLDIHNCRSKLERNVTFAFTGFTITITGRHTIPENEEQLEESNWFNQSFNPNYNFVFKVKYTVTVLINHIFLTISTSKVDYSLIFIYSPGWLPLLQHNISKPSDMFIKVFV